jgi:hypothetical protein
MDTIANKVGGIAANGEDQKRLTSLRSHAAQAGGEGVRQINVSGRFRRFSEER